MRRATGPVGWGARWVRGLLLTHVHTHTHTHAHSLFLLFITYTSEVVGDHSWTSSDILVSGNRSRFQDQPLAQLYVAGP